MGGVKHHIRGIDEFGNCANTVESELMIYKHTKSDDEGQLILDQYSFR